MVYDPLLVDVIVDGNIVTDFATGTMVTAQRNNDRMTPYHGVKGEWGLSKNADNSGNIVVTVQQGSPANVQFQQLANTNAVFPINIIDSNAGGEFRAGGTQAIIQTEPAIERGAEITERAWTFYVFDYSCVEG